MAFKVFPGPTMPILESYLEIQHDYIRHGLNALHDSLISTLLSTLYMRGGKVDLLREPYFWSQQSARAMFYSSV